MNENLKDEPRSGSLARPVRWCPFCEISRGCDWRTKRPEEPLVKEARLDSTRWVPVCACHAQRLEYSAHTIVETRPFHSANEIGEAQPPAK